MFTAKKEILSCYLCPYFTDDLRLKQLTPLFIEGACADILAIRSKQTKKFLEKAILEKIRSLLKQILAYNYRHDLVLFDLNKVVLKIPNDRKIPAVHAKDILRGKYPEFNKHVTMHTFRYTHISLLAEASVLIKVIMDRVGYSNMKTTLEIYNQVTSATKEKVIQEVDSWIF